MSPDGSGVTDGAGVAEATGVRVAPGVAVGAALGAAEGEALGEAPHAVATTAIAKAARRMRTIERPGGRASEGLIVAILARVFGWRFLNLPGH